MDNTSEKRFRISVEKLEFDRHNPRLVASETDLRNAPDEVILRELVKDADIGELISSINANGYMDIEPIIVTQEGVRKKGNYRVLEGNRRLSAIRFLRNPELATKCRLSMPKEISSGTLQSVSEVTVYEVANEHEARAFIGFKHINGAHRWDSYAKARFIAQWYHDDYSSGITIEDIAYKLGDNNQQVRSLLGGMLVLKQAEDAELFDISDRTKPGTFGFSHLYTALARLEYRQFLGLDKDWNQRPSKSPIPSDQEEKLKEVLVYIYGSKKDNKESVIKSQNPDLADLGKVLKNKEALAILRSTSEFKASVEYTKDPAGVFSDALIIARSRVNDALRKISKFDPVLNPELVTVAEELLGDSEIIEVTLKRKISNIAKVKKG